VTCTYPTPRLRRPASGGSRAVRDVRPWRGVDHSEAALPLGRLAVTRLHATPLPPDPTTVSLPCRLPTQGWRISIRSAEMGPHAGATRRSVRPGGRGTCSGAPAPRMPLHRSAAHLSASKRSARCAGSGSRRRQRTVLGTRTSSAPRSQTGSTVHPCFEEDVVAVVIQVLALALGEPPRIEPGLAYPQAFERLRVSHGRDQQFSAEAAP
jgi:hypothetical protein